MIMVLPRRDNTITNKKKFLVILFFRFYDLEI